MIAVHHRQMRKRTIDRAVLKVRSTSLEHPVDGCRGHTTQRDNAAQRANTRPPERRDIVVEETSAVAEFFTRRAIARRHTTNGVGDAIRNCVGNAGVLECGKERTPGIITTKGIARSVGAVHARREADNQESCRARTGRRNRRVEVGRKPLTVAGPILDQARTRDTVDRPSSHVFRPFPLPRDAD